MKVVESLVGQELGRPVVEVGIELMDHAFIAKNREKTDREGWKRRIKLKQYQDVNYFLKKVI